MTKCDRCYTQVNWVTNMKMTVDNIGMLYKLEEQKIYDTNAFINLTDKRIKDIFIQKTHCM